MGRLTGREVLGAALAVTVLAALAHLTAPTVWESPDYLRFHEPMRVFGAEALRTGRLPLWNPHVNLGRPHLADLQAGVIYPSTLVYLVAPASVAFFLSGVAHLLLGVVGLRLLASYLGLERRLAWAVAFVFFFSGPVTTTFQTGIVEGVQTIAWIPWVLLLAARLGDRPGVARLAALAVVLALQLVSGHVQYAWIGVVGTAFFLVGRGLERWRSGRSALASARTAAIHLALLAVAAGWAVLIDAVQLLPFFELVGQGNRGERSLAFASAWSMPWIDWVTLVRPVKDTFVVNWVDNLYAGTLVAVAAVAGAVVRRADRNVRGLLLVTLVAALIAAGDRTPAFGALFHLLPGLSSFRLHARAAVMVVLSLALLAGMLVQGESAGTADGAGGVVAARDRGRRRKVVALVGVAVAIGAIGVVVVELGIEPALRSWTEALLRVGLLAGAASLLALLTTDGGWASDPPKRRALVLGALAFAAGDLALATVRMKASIPPISGLPAERPIVAELARRGLLAPGAPLHEWRSPTLTPARTRG